MRIMTSNVWGEYFGNPVIMREDLLFKIYKNYSPDVLGVQEYNTGWYKGNLIDWMASEYSTLGTELFNPDNVVDERAFDKTNYVPLFIKRNLGILSYGFEYLKDTPDKSKGITWAVLKENGKVFGVCNTHFWWDNPKYWPKDHKNHHLRRSENARQLIALMKYLQQKYNCPVFAFGDMNTTILSETYEVYRENGIVDLNDIAEIQCEVGSQHANPVILPDGRCKGEKTAKDRTGSIDHILVLGDGFRVREYKVIEDQEALDSTDHSPVYADIEL